MYPDDIGGGGLLSKRVGSVGGGLAMVVVSGAVPGGGRSSERYSEEDNGGRGRGEEPFSAKASSEAAELREEERCSARPARNDIIHELKVDIHVYTDVFVCHCL